MTESRVAAAVPIVAAFVTIRGPSVSNAPPTITTSGTGAAWPLMQALLVNERRKTNQRLDFSAEELVTMGTNERISRLESAVAELQRKVG